MATDGWVVIFNRLNFHLFIAFLWVHGCLSEIVSQSYEARPLLEYRSYRDVQILRYTVPPLVSLASWEFRSNGSLHCSPRNIHLYLQYGSYPVISPDNASYPRLLSVNRISLHSITLQSDNQPVQLNVSVPLPGDWFAVAFIRDKTEKIAQKGLFQPCLAWLLSSLKNYQEENVLFLESGIPHHQRFTFQTQNFRFFAPNKAWSVQITLSKCGSDLHDSCPLVIRSRPRALCTSDEFHASVNCSRDSICSLDMVPAENDWNYLQVEPQSESKVEYEIKVTTAVCPQPPENIFKVAALQQIPKPQKITKPRKSKKRNLTSSTLPPARLSLTNDPCWPQVALVRTNDPGYFAFRFDQVPDENDTISLILNLTAHKTTLAKFDIQSVVDTGGTLAVEMLLLPSINTTLSNVSVEACLQYGTRPKPTGQDKCPSNMAANMNTSASESYVGAILVPYPEAGPWYLSLYTRCYFQETEVNESEVVDVACSSNNIPIIFQIKSTQCILGQCGRYGKCYQYMSDVFVFSTCVCQAGWRGWGCTDGTHALSNSELLLNVLLLTLSNILFIPAIVLAIHRHFFTEALVYLVTMVFSALYHACDAEVFSMCVMRLSVMQFCDFYSAILSVWVTLIAMANMPHSLQSLAHMAGAVAVALGVEYDRTGLWVFVIPATVGLLLVFISWFYHCHQQQMCYPHKRVWVFCLLPGVLLAGTGLLLFTFLETSQNYPYVHSSWHASMALCILFLLPERRNQKVRPAPTNNLDNTNQQPTVSDHEKVNYVINRVNIS